MKLQILIETDVSKTIAETMQRNGFTICPDGSAMQIRMPHTPPIPKRKTKIIFVQSPNAIIETFAEQSRSKSNGNPEEQKIV